MKVAFLHTLKSNVAKFEDLVTRHFSDIETLHFVNEALLSSALTTGKLDVEGFDNEVEMIVASDVDRIICTCSTYGEASDRHPAVERIDRPIVEYMLEKYSVIGLAYAAKSTRDISWRLIDELARNTGKEIEVIDIDCTSAWPFFEKQNFEEYYQIIARTLKEATSAPEVIFLAQASMEGAKEYLQDFEKEVLTSPEYGVKKLIV